MKASEIVRATAALLFLVWAGGFIAGAGPWIHGLLFAAIMLLSFDIVVARRESGR